MSDGTEKTVICVRRAPLRELKRSYDEGFRAGKETIAAEFRTRSELNQPYVWQPPMISEVDPPARIVTGENSPTAPWVSLVTKKRIRFNGTYSPKETWRILSYVEVMPIFGLMRKALYCIARRRSAIMVRRANQQRTINLIRQLFNAYAALIVSEKKRDCRLRSHDEIRMNLSLRECEILVHSHRLVLKAQVPF